MRGSNAILVAGLVALVAGLSGTSLADDRSAPETDVAPASEAGSPDSAPPLVEPGEAPWIVEEDRAAPELETDPLDGGGTAPRDEGEGDSSRDGRKGKGKDKGDEKKQPLAKASVTIEDFQYKPETITVKPGDEVGWTNRDTAQHNAVGQGDADFNTGLLAKGEHGTVPFNENGTFDYICTVHPDMKGKVVVRENTGSDTDGTSGTSGTSSGTGSTFPTGGTGSDFSTGSSSGGGSLPNTGQDQLPLLLLGAGLIVFGLLARAFHEYWIWR